MAEVSFLTKPIVQGDTSRSLRTSPVALKKLERALSCPNCSRPCNSLEQAINCLTFNCQPVPLLENGISGLEEASTQDSLGSQLQTVCPTKCYTTGSGTHVAVLGETATVTVHIIDQDGMEYHSPVEVSCELVSSDGTSQGRGEVESIGENKYKISYSPQRRGRDKLHVKVEGKHIKGSPFTVAAISTTPTCIIQDLKGPSGVTVNGKGELVVVESTGHCVSFFNANGEKVRSFGSYGSDCGEFDFPHGVDVTAAGNILVCEFMSKRFQMLSAEGTPLRCVGTKYDGSSHVCALVNRRSQRSIDPRLMKTGPSRRRRRVSLALGGPRDIAVHPHSQRIYLTDYNTHRVDIHNADLTFFSTFGGKGSGDGQFDNPYGIAFNSTAFVFVADHCNHRIQVFTDSGVYVRQFGGGGSAEGELNGPCGLAIDSCDIVYVSERYTHRISLFTQEGQFLKAFGMQGNGPGQFMFPCDIALDKEEAIYVCDLKNDSVQVF